MARFFFAQKVKTKKHIGKLERQKLQDYKHKYIGHMVLPGSKLESPFLLITLWNSGSFCTPLSLMVSSLLHESREVDVAGIEKLGGGGQVALGPCYPPCQAFQPESSTLTWLRWGVSWRVHLKIGLYHSIYLKTTVSYHSYICFLYAVILRDMFSAFWNFTSLYELRTFSLGSSECLYCRVDINPTIITIVKVVKPCNRHRVGVISNHRKAKLVLTQLL